LLEPVPLPVRVDLQEHVLAVGRGKEVDRSKGQTQFSDDRRARPLDLGRKLDCRMRQVNGMDTSKVVDGGFDARAADLDREHLMRQVAEIKARLNLGELPEKAG